LAIRVRKKPGGQRDLCREVVGSGGRKKKDVSRQNYYSARGTGPNEEGGMSREWDKSKLGGGERAAISKHTTKTSAVTGGIPKNKDGDVNVREHFTCWGRGLAQGGKSKEGVFKRKSEKKKGWPTKAQY